MRKSLLNKVLILAVLCTMASCKTKKEVAVIPPPTETTPTEGTTTTSPETVNRLIAAGFDFKTLSAKAKAEMSISNNSNSVNMNLRMRKDEAIWVSLTALAGIEVARALITPDSIKVINRLQGEYTAQPFRFIYQFAGRQITFGALQALLTGNALPGTLHTGQQLTLLDRQIQMNGQLEGINYTMLFNADSKLVQNSLKDAVTGQSLSAVYGSFQELAGAKLPLNILLQSYAGSKNVRLDLKYNAVSVNEPVDLPFSVPKRYTEK